jgi:predicted aspartyl protease
LARWGHAFAGVDAQIVSFPEKPISLRLKTTVLGTPTIRVRINGKDYDFWVDTGSSMTVLSSKVAAEASVPILSGDTLTIRTFAGHAQVKPALVSRMEIGAIVFTNTPAIVMEASLMRLKASGDGIPMAGLPVDGIIGWDTIRHLDVLMDYDRGTITLQRPESFGTRGAESRNLIWVGKPFVELRTKNGALLHFTLDTGAQSSFLNASVLEKADAMTSITTARVYGLAQTGREAGRMVPSLTVDIGGKSVRLQRVIVYGPNYSGIVNCDGILGSDIALFGRIRIDATNGIFAIDA